MIEAQNGKRMTLDDIYRTIFVMKWSIMEGCLWKVISDDHFLKKES